MTTERELSEGWRILPFAEIADNINERVDDPSSSGLDHYVGLEHLDPDTLKISRWGSPTDVEATKLRFYPGDVIYARRRAYQRKLGVAEWDGIASAHSLVLRAHPDVCLPGFLPYFLQSDQFHQRALDISVGSLSPTINWKALAAQEFVLPPVEQQERIVEVLAAIDAVAAAYAGAAMETRQVVQALVTEAAATGKVTSLGELASNGGIQIGPFGSQLHAHEYTDEGVPVVMPSDMTADGLKLDSIRRVPESTAERLRTHRVRPGDILLPRRGELDKRVLITNSETGWLCGTGSVRVRLDDPVDAPLVERLLAGTDTVRWLEANAVGTTMPNLNGDIVSRIPLPLPPADERHAYAERLRSLRSFGAAATAAADSTTSARRAILNAMLQGAYR